MSDPQKYRSKEEVGRYQEHDPIGRLEKQLRDSGALDEAKVQAINEEIHNQVEAAHALADADPFPDNQEVWQDIYSNPYGPYQA